MSRHDHFRQWLVEQSPHAAAPAPSSARAKYALPEYRLSDPTPWGGSTPINHPVWIDPQGMTPPIFAPSGSPVSQATASVNLPPVPQSSRAIAPALQRVHPIRTASLPGSPPPHPPSSKPPRRSEPFVLKGYSYGMIIAVWLSLLGLGGYAMSRLADPLFTTSQPSPATPVESPSATPEPSPSHSVSPPDPGSSPTRSASRPPNPRSSPAPSPSTPTPPNLFDYADARPRSSSSPMWALVAIITASALGSRLIAQQSRSRRDR